MHNICALILIHIKINRQTTHLPEHTYLLKHIRTHTRTHVHTHTRTCAGIDIQPGRVCWYKYYPVITIQTIRLFVAFSSISTCISILKSDLLSIILSHKLVSTMCRLCIGLCQQYSSLYRLVSTI